MSNDGWKFELSEVKREGLFFTIGITAEGPYQSNVRSPRMVAYIESNKDNRRFPIAIKAYFPSEDMSKATVYAEDVLEIDNIFLDERDCDYKIKFDFTYGDKSFDHIVFKDRLSDKALEKNSVRFDDKNNLMILVADKRNGKLIQTIKKIMKPLYQYFCYLLSALLLPWHFLDAIASICLEISETYPRNEGRFLKRFLTHVSWRFSKVSKKDVGVTGIKIGILKFFFALSSILPVKKNQVLFLSSRRTDLTGNFSFVHDELTKDNKVKMKYILDPTEAKKMSIKALFKIAYLTATSKIILVDDFTPILYNIKLRRKTQLIQLWHACGAFKTFGFSRNGKRGAPLQNSLNHRNYDWAIVSSDEIRKFYAEGFGVAVDKIIAPGIPRTDVFFDPEYKETMRAQLFEQYPQLVDKKVIMFAPTFRGDGKVSANYPKDKFDPVQFMNKLSQEYVLVIKHHPFVKETYDIPTEYQDRILDLSKQSEINDLLFVTDILITDYSSVVFEAALLDIPMLMYAYDLRQYIASRDFYYDYEYFVPGKIVAQEEEMLECIKNNDFEQDKLETFKTRFFDYLDGQSTKRVVQHIYDLMGL